VFRHYNKPPRLVNHNTRDYGHYVIASLSHLLTDPTCRRSSWKGYTLLTFANKANLSQTQPKTYSLEFCNYLLSRHNKKCKGMCLSPQMATDIAVISQFSATSKRAKPSWQRKVFHY